MVCPHVHSPILFTCCSPNTPPSPTPPEFCFVLACYQHALHSSRFPFQQTSSKVLSVPTASSFSPCPHFKFTSVSSHPSLATTPVLVKPTYGLHVAKSMTTLSPHLAHILTALAGMPFLLNTVSPAGFPLDSCPLASSPLLCPAFLL